MITENPADLVSAAKRITEADGRLSFSGWKGFADGSFGGHTASMYEPFADKPDATGTLRLYPGQALDAWQTPHSKSVAGWPCMPSETGPTTPSSMSSTA